MQRLLQNDIHLCLGVLGGHAGLQSSDQREPGSVACIAPMTSANDLWLHAQGQEEIHLFAPDITIKAGGRYTDHREGMAVQAKVPADDRGRKRELAPPISTT